MSQSFTFDSTKKPVASHDVMPNHQLPGQRPVVEQPTPQTTEPNTKVQRARMARVDAGVMRSLNMQALRTPGHRLDTATAVNVAQREPNAPIRRWIKIGRYEYGKGKATGTGKPRKKLNWLACQEAYKKRKNRPYTWEKVKTVIEKWLKSPQQQIDAKTYKELIEDAENELEEAANKQAIARRKRVAKRKRPAKKSGGSRKKVRYNPTSFTPQEKRKRLSKLRRSLSLNLEEVKELAKTKEFYRSKKRARGNPRVHNTAKGFTVGTRGTGVFLLGGTDLAEYEDLFDQLRSLTGQSGQEMASELLKFFTSRTDKPYADFTEGTKKVANKLLALMTGAELRRASGNVTSTEKLLTQLARRNDGFNIFEEFKKHLLYVIGHKEVKKYKKYKDQPGGSQFSQFYRPRNKGKDWKEEEPFLGIAAREHDMLCTEVANQGVDPMDYDKLEAALTEDHTATVKNIQAQYGPNWWKDDQ